MDVLIDVSIISHILIMIFALNFVNEVDTCRLKTRGIVKFIIIEMPLIFTIYLKPIYGTLITSVITLILFIIFFKKRFVLPMIEYIFCYYYIGFMMSLLSPNVIFLNYFLVVTSVKGIWSLLVIPIQFGILKIVCLLVDKLYHLGKYSRHIIVCFYGQYMKAKGYYDTGNFLKHKGLPVVFFKRQEFPFALPNEYETIEYMTTSGYNSTKLYKASIIIDHRKESYIYIALLNNDYDFNGCDCLLNVYLGV